MEAGKRTFYLGRYNCIEQLGTGPLGDTYRAKIYGVAGFEKQFAVKRLHPHLSGDEAFVARFVTAASAFAALENPRIARVHEVNAQGTHYYIVVDLVRGLDLRQLLDLLQQRGERLPAEVAMGIALDVAEALAYAHERTAALPGGVFHLGLTAPSVMVTYDGELKLVDFGLMAALVRPGWSSDDALTPTLAYLPPEVWRGEAVDGRADLFSLGILLHEMVGGSRVFISDRVSELRAMIESGPPPAPAADSQLQALISRALQPDPARRFASAAELCEALQSLLGDARESARGELSALVRRLVMPRERRTGAFAAVTMVPDSTESVTPVATTPTPVPTPARAWAPPMAKPPVAPVMTPVPMQSTLTGIGPDDPALEAAGASAAPTAAPAATRKSAASAGASEDAETSRFARSEAADLLTPGGNGHVEAETSRFARAEATELTGSAASEQAESDEPEVNVIVHEINDISGLTMEASAEIQPASQVDSGATTVEVRANGDGREVAGGIAASANGAPEPSWTPPPLAAPPPSPTPSFAPVFAAPPEPIDRPRFSVPGTKLPRRQTSNRLITATIVTLAVAGVAAVYVGLNGGRPLEKQVAPSTGTGGNAMPRQAEDPSSGPAPVATTKPATPTAPARPANDELPTAPPIETAKTAGTKPTAAVVNSPAMAAREIEPIAPKAKQAQAVAAPPAAEPAARTATEKGAAGTITIATTPAGASVFIVGQPRGTTPAQLALGPGSHKLVLAGEHRKLVQRSLNGAGEPIELTLEPAALPSEVAGQAGLKVRCKSQGELRILVDGADTGLSCPNDERISVKPGLHKIGLFSPRTGETHELEHEIAEGGHSTRVYVKF